MKCDQYKLIDDYLVQTLSQEELESFDEHLFNCDECFREVVFREKIAHFIKEEGNIVFADYLAKQKTQKANIFRSLFKNFFHYILDGHKKRFYIPVAVGASIVLCLFIYNNLIPLIKNNKVAVISNFEDKPGLTMQSLPAEELSDTQTEGQPEHSVKSPQPEQKNHEQLTESATTDISLDMQHAFTANFEPSPYLEEMVSDVSRAPSLTVLSPKNGEEIKQNIVFRWEGAQNNVIYLNILNNKGIRLFNFKVDSNQFVFREQLQPGLYYWKLESEDDLMYIGKFFMDK